MISMLLAHRFVIHGYYFYRVCYFAVHNEPGWGGGGGVTPYMYVKVGDACQKI